MWQHRTWSPSKQWKVWFFFKSVPGGVSGAGMEGGVVFYPPPTLPYSVMCTFFFYKFISPDAKRDLEPPACPTKTIQQLRRKGSIHALFSIGARNTRPCLSTPPNPPFPKTSFSTARAGWQFAILGPPFVYLFQRRKRRKIETQEHLTPVLESL